MAKLHIIHVDDGVCDTARQLLASGEAQPEDRIEAYRGDQLCLYANVGTAAKYQLFGFKFVKYNPDIPQNKKDGN